MKKKIVALLCAAMLAFGMPATAFAAATNFVVGEDGLVTAAFGGDIRSGSGVIKNVKISGTAGMVATAEIVAAGTSGGPSNAVPGTVSAFDLTFRSSDGQVVPSVGTKYNNMSFTYQVDDSALANLPSGTQRDNLYLGGRLVNKAGGQATNLNPMKLQLDNDASAVVPGIGGSVTINGYVGTSTLTLWVQNGKYASADANPPVSNTNDSSDDGNDEPRTIDGMPEIPVAGTSGVVAWGNLAGPNIPAGARISLAAVTVTNGGAYNELRAAMGSGQLLGVFQVDLSVNGTEIHNGFGELGLAFPMPYGNEGRTVTVWHRHNDGSITSQAGTIKDSEVRITTQDLSDFAIEMGAPADNDNTVSPKTGQSIPAGTALAALGTAVVLGAASVLFAKRKMTR